MNLPNTTFPFWFKPDRQMGKYKDPLTFRLPLPPPPGASQQHPATTTNHQARSACSPSRSSAWLWNPVLHNKPIGPPLGKARTSNKSSSVQERIIQCILPGGKPPERNMRISACLVSKGNARKKSTCCPWGMAASRTFVTDATDIASEQQRTCILQRLVVYSPLRHSKLEWSTGHEHLWVT